MAHHTEPFGIIRSDAPRATNRRLGKLKIDICNRPCTYLVEVGVKPHNGCVVGLDVSVNKGNAVKINAALFKDVIDKMSHCKVRGSFHVFS